MENNSPSAFRLSVIVPVYNAEKYLTRCIESVLGQTHTELELILVDDGSGDGSGEICDGFAARDRRVRVIHKQNAGVSAARNDGIEAASGEFIAFCDNDDFYAPEMLERLLGMCVANDCDIAQCGVRKGTAESLATSGPQPVTVMTGREMLEDFYTRASIYVWDKLYRREVWAGVGGCLNFATEGISDSERELFLHGERGVGVPTASEPDGKSTGTAAERPRLANSKQPLRFPVGSYTDEDQQVAHRLLGAARRVASTPEVLYYHYIHPASVMNRGFDVRWATGAMDDRLDFARRECLPRLYAETVVRRLYKERYLLAMNRRYNRDAVSRGEFHAEHSALLRRCYRDAMATAGVSLKQKAFMTMCRFTPTLYHLYNWLKWRVVRGERSVRFGEIK